MPESTWSQVRSLRWGLAILILFVASFFKSCSELKLTIWGETATAKITSSEESMYTTGRLRNRPAGQYVTMVFTDHEGRQRLAKRTIPSSIPPPLVDDELEIIYMPGDPERAILVAERSWLWPAVFLGMIVTAVAWSIWIYRRMEAGHF